jgi:hypothetical protein
MKSVARVQHLWFPRPRFGTSPPPHGKTSTMNPMTHAHHADGATAVVPRAGVQQPRGYRWQFMAFPCTNSSLAMNITGTKRHPRRLGRST